MFDWGESELMGRAVQSLHRGDDRTVTVQLRLVFEIPVLYSAAFAVEILLLLLLLTASTVCQERYSANQIKTPIS